MNSKLNMWIMMMMVICLKGQEIGNYSGHTGIVMSVDFSPDGK